MTRASRFNWKQKETPMTNQPKQRYKEYVATLSANGHGYLPVEYGRLLIYNPEDPTRNAERLATAMFLYTTDLAGKPYVDHVRRVADRVAYCGDDVIVVAWLHDLVEDTRVTLDDLRYGGYPEHIVQAIDAITQREGEPLESYWTRVANNRIAWIVKLHGDMPDNNDPARRVLDTHRNNKIGSKYATAIDFFWQQTRSQGQAGGQ